MFHLPLSISCDELLFLKFNRQEVVQTIFNPIVKLLFLVVDASPLLISALTSSLNFLVCLSHHEHFFFSSNLEQNDLCAIAHAILGEFRPKVLYELCVFDRFIS